MKISSLRPDHIVCPACKHEIKINYEVEKKFVIPEVEDVINIHLTMKRISLSSEKGEYKRHHCHAYICTHCKGIIGFSVS